jgi:hypothetical protein
LRKATYLVFKNFSPQRALSRRAWKVLSAYLKAGVSCDDAVPGGVIAVQTFGDFLNFNPHLHMSKSQTET